MEYAETSSTLTDRTEDGMDRATATVVRGFTRLSDSQRREFIQQINEYMEGNYERKALIASAAQRDMLRVDMGPLSGGCPCCGK